MAARAARGGAAADDQQEDAQLEAVLHERPTKRSQQHAELVAERVER